MRVGLFISLCLHLGVLAWGLVSLSSARTFKAAAPEPVAVSLVTPDDLTRLRQGSRKAKAETATPRKSKAKTNPRKPKPKAKPIPPRATAPAAPPPDPIAQRLKQEAEARAAAAAKAKARAAAKAKAAKAKAAEAKAKALAAKKAAAAKAKRKREAEARKRRAEAKKRAAAAAKKKREAARRKREAERKRKLAEAKRKKANAFDADKMAALLNKIPDRAQPPPAAPETDDPPPRKPQARAGAPEGRDQRLTASEMALLARAIKAGVQPCWNVLGGGQGAEATEVKVRIRFKQDGTLARPPEIVNSGSSAFFIAAADSARRAIEQCQPYRLPASKYHAWRDVILRFRPEDMF
ncbi:MAG: cell envelope integrity protein TolA [Pseudomonadota bacterium]